MIVHENYTTGTSFLLYIYISTFSYLSGYFFLICCLCALSLCAIISMSGSSFVPKPFMASCMRSTSSSTSNDVAGFMVPPFLACACEYKSTMLFSMNHSLLETSITVHYNNCILNFILFQYFLRIYLAFTGFVCQNSLLGFGLIPSNYTDHN